MGVEGIGRQIEGAFRALIGIIVTLVVLLVIAIVAIAVLARQSHAQYVRGVVLDPARSVLVRNWPTEPTAPERAYCVTRWAAGVPFGPETYTYVFDVLATSDSGADPYQSAVVTCPLAEMPVLHTHPPSTCELTPFGRATRCVPGGLDAWLCSPSVPDLEFLFGSARPFDIVQCDRNAFVFYFNPRRHRDSTPSPRP